MPSLLMPAKNNLPPTFVSVWGIAWMLLTRLVPAWVPSDFHRPNCPLRLPLKNSVLPTAVSPWGITSSSSSWVPAEVPSVRHKLAPDSVVVAEK